MNNAELEIIRKKRLAQIRNRKPSMRTVEAWLSAGIAQATDGCDVETDGTCPHGKKSWLIVLGMV